MHDRCPFVPGVQISLKGERVRLRQGGVDPETAMQQMPSIPAASSADRRERIVSQKVCEHAVGGILSDRSTVLYGSETLPYRASAPRHCSAGGVLSFLRNDIDHPVYGVVTPDCASRPSNHLDSVNVLQRHIHGVPVDSPQQ